MPIPGQKLVNHFWMHLCILIIHYTAQLPNLAKVEHARIHQFVSNIKLP